MKQLELCLTCDVHMGGDKGIRSSWSAFVKMQVCKEKQKVKTVIINLGWFYFAEGWTQQSKYKIFSHISHVCTMNAFHWASSAKTLVSQLCSDLFMLFPQGNSTIRWCFASVSLTLLSTCFVS